LNIVNAGTSSFSVNFVLCIHCGAKAAYFGSASGWRAEPQPGREDDPFERTVWRYTGRGFFAPGDHIRN
jgi:hypothetical protein